MTLGLRTILRTFKLFVNFEIENPSRHSSNCLYSLTTVLHQAPYPITPMSSREKRRRYLSPLLEPQAKKACYNVKPRVVVLASLGVNNLPMDLRGNGPFVRGG